MATRPDSNWIDSHGHEIGEEDGGLAYDLHTLINRRRLLGLLAPTRRGLAAATRPPTDRPVFAH